MASRKFVSQIYSTCQPICTSPRQTGSVGSTWSTRPGKTNAMVDLDDITCAQPETDPNLSPVSSMSRILRNATWISPRRFQKNIRNMNMVANDTGFSFFTLLHVFFLSRQYQSRILPAKNFAPKLYVTVKTFQTPTIETSKTTNCPRHPNSKQVWRCEITKKIWPQDNSRFV